MSGEDRPGVLAPPPLIYGVGLFVGLVAEWLAPLGLPGSPTPAVRYATGGVLAVLALVLAGTAIRQFRRAGTAVEPWHPATALVADGLYRFSRNPIYVALTLLYLSVAIAAASGWTLVMLIPVLTVMEFGVVRREEAYLEAKFGEHYRAYKNRVRRWF